jgi:hypothetical protein
LVAVEGSEPLMKAAEYGIFLAYHFEDSSQQ